MSSRRILAVLGPALGLGAMFAIVACGCVSWTFPGGTAIAFVSRGLSESYGVTLRATGDTKIALLPLPRVTFEGVRLTAGDADGPVLSEGGRLALQLSPTSLLLGRAEVVSLALDGAKIVLPTDDDRWAAPVERLTRHLANEDIARPRRISLTRVTLENPATSAASEIDATILWPLWSDTLHCGGSLVWRGVTARFAVTNLHPREFGTDGSTPFAATATWDGGLLETEGIGTTQDGLKLVGQARLKTRSLPETLAWIGSGMPLAPLVAEIALDGTYEASREHVRLSSVRVDAGGTVLEGAGSIEMAERPSLRATLATELLNLGPLLASGLRIAGLDGSSQGWGQVPLALGPLLGGDLDLRLSAARARLGPVLVEDLASSVIVRSTGIDVAIGKASVQDGSLKGRVTMAPSATDGAVTEVRAQGAFDKLDLAALLIDLGQYGWVLGSTQGAFALEGMGATAESLLRQTNGRATVAVDGGAIAGLDLAELIQRGGVTQTALARRAGRTPFDRASVSIAFAKGVGEINEGSLNAKALTATLRGRVALPERTFQARALLLPRTASAAESASFASTLFEIAGPWDAVAVRASQDERGSGDPLTAPGATLPGLPTSVRAYAP